MTPEQPPERVEDARDWYIPEDSVYEPQNPWVVQFNDGFEDEAPFYQYPAGLP